MGPRPKGIQWDAARLGQLCDDADDDNVDDNNNDNNNDYDGVDDNNNDNDNDSRFDS